MIKLIIRKLTKYLFIVACLVTILVLGNVYTYTRLTDEEPIAKLIFKSINTQEFEAHLRLGNFCESKTYQIYGDEWRIDAGFLKWKSWATLFGADSMYRIERLSGRYTSIDDENSKNHSAHELNSDSTFELAEFADQYRKALPIIDTVYGSSAYEIMKPETLFTVFRTQSGILVREEINNTNIPQDNCVNNKSIWKTTVLFIDQQIASLVHAI